MGHEFCCEVVELGPDVSNLTPGQVVVSMPAVFDADGIHAVGYSSRYPGGYAELLVLNELLAIPVPDGVPPSLAAMTEPLAVGVHAVNKSRITGQDAAIVLGLGPVGLACVAELKMRGIGPVIGADFSSRRRSLAEHLGCDVVVDPRAERVIDVWRRGRRCPPAGDLRSRRCARHDRAGHADGAQGRPRPRRRACACRRIGSIRCWASGASSASSSHSPTNRIEFAAALRSIADGAVDLAPLVTGTVDIDGVPAAFDELADPEGHAKIMVRTRLSERRE